MTIRPRPERRLGLHGRWALQKDGLAVDNGTIAHALDGNVVVERKQRGSETRHAVHWDLNQSIDPMPPRPLQCVANTSLGDWTVLHSHRLAFVRMQAGSSIQHGDLVR